MYYLKVLALVLCTGLALPSLAQAQHRGYGQQQFFQRGHQRQFFQRGFHVAPFRSSFYAAPIVAPVVIPVPTVASIITEPYVAPFGFTQSYSAPVTGCVQPFGFGYGYGGSRLVTPFRQGQRFRFGHR